ncbi:MAG: BCCT family transporter [Mobilitalea sp.]
MLNGISNTFVCFNFITLFLITTFFVTSADSATFVLGRMTTNGSLEPANMVKYT